MKFDHSLTLITVVYFYKYFFEFSFLTFAASGSGRSLLKVAQWDMSYMDIDVLFMRFKIYRPEPEGFFDDHDGLEPEFSVFDDNERSELKDFLDDNDGC